MYDKLVNDTPYVSKEFHRYITVIILLATAGVAFISANSDAIGASPQVVTLIGNAINIVVTILRVLSPDPVAPAAAPAKAVSAKRTVTSVKAKK